MKAGVRWTGDRGAVGALVDLEIGIVGERPRDRITVWRGHVRPAGFEPAT